MTRLSMNEMTTYRWSFEEDVVQYAAAGIDAIAVWRPKLSDFGEERGIDLIEECGLDVSCLMWAGGFTGSDGRTHKESIQDAKDALRVAVGLSAKCLTVYSGPRAGHTHSHARRLLTSALKELAPIACEHGIALAIEPVHEGCASEWTFLNHLDETLEIISKVNCAQLKLAFDVYQLAHETSVLDELPALVEKLAIVQLGDAKSLPDGDPNRCHLGDGYLPWREVVRTLDNAGYDGYYDIKLMGEDIEHSDYLNLIRDSKAAFDELFVS